MKPTSEVGSPTASVGANDNRLDCACFYFVVFFQQNIEEAKVKKIFVAAMVVCAVLLCGCKDEGKNAATMTVTGEVLRSSLKQKALTLQPVTTLVVRDDEGMNHYLSLNGERKDLLEAKKISVTFSKEEFSAHTEETVIEERPDGSRAAVTKKINWLTITEYKVLESKLKEDEYPK